MYISSVYHILHYIPYVTTGRPGFALKWFFSKKKTKKNLTSMHEESAGIDGEGVLSLRLSQSKQQPADASQGVIVTRSVHKKKQFVSLIFP